MTSSRGRNLATLRGGPVPIPERIGSLGVNLNAGDIGELLGDHKHTLTPNPTTDTNMHRRATAL